MEIDQQLAQAQVERIAVYIDLRRGSVSTCNYGCTGSVIRATTDGGFGCLAWHTPVLDASICTNLAQRVEP